MAILEQPTLQLNVNDPKPDYIVIFDTTVTPPLAADEKPPTKAEAGQKLQDEYGALLGLLTDAGLQATGRSGGKNSGKILVFVRADEARVQAEIHRER